MLQETMEMDDDEEMEDEANEEVDKVLLELTQGILGGVSAPVGPELILEKNETVKPEIDEMKNRLEALRS
ncbi:hypothetical protein HDU92_008427 [Lobulomyces angularis]|nr:hypothetical protein HDU92_008427 [Lobulomyces angularis]